MAPTHSQARPTPTEAKTTNYMQLHSQHNVANSAVNGAIQVLSSKRSFTKSGQTTVLHAAREPDKALSAERQTDQACASSAIDIPSVVRSARSAPFESKIRMESYRAIDRYSIIAASAMRICSRHQTTSYSRLVGAAISVTLRAK